MTQCHNCHKFGHKQFDCPSSKKSQACFNCGQTGHKKSDCTGVPKNRRFSEAPLATQGANLMNSSKKECYDCHQMVDDLKSHRSVCPNSKYSKSAIDPAKHLNVPANVKTNQKDLYFLLDVSGSMSGSKLDQSKECLRSVVSQMDPFDRIAVVSFDTSAYFKLKPRPIQEFIRKQEIEPLLNRIFAQGQTAIYDAIHMSVSQLHDKNQKTVMMVLTDGDDNSSKHTYNEVTEMLKEYPNIALNIIHIDGKTSPNISYQNLCTDNHGEYVIVEQHEIKITVEHIFKKYYLAY